MQNTQAPERKINGTGETIDLHSIFFTIQGEGPFTGHRSIFIRLAGCNLQCPGCDTEYTEGRQELRIEDIAMRAMTLAHQYNLQGFDGLNFPLVVITGGEPLRQPIGKLVRHLMECNFKVQIETNGMFAPDKELFDLCMSTIGPTVVVSPKTSKIHTLTETAASCFKYVLQAGYVDAEDGLPMFALEHMKGGRPFRSAKNRKIYLNPYDEKDTVKNAANLAACAESCKKFGYILGVQLHKLAGLE